VEEDKDQRQKGRAKKNKAKNRKILISLIALFATPVMFAYVAYFGNWFESAGAAQGELIDIEKITDIEDYTLTRVSGDVYTGKEFETLYWWLIPIQKPICDQKCVDLNLYVVHQTYIGLGKEASRINQLVVLETESVLNVGSFPVARSRFSNTGIQAVDKKVREKKSDLPSNFIYLVDPLGNIFMRYPLIDDKSNAAELSKKLRTDILHLFKYSRLG